MLAKNVVPEQFGEIKSEPCSYIFMASQQAGNACFDAGVGDYTIQCPRWGLLQPASWIRLESIP